MTPGTPRTPAISASTASGAIATFMNHSRSAMWCSEPGKPTSVSSSSPVAGLTCAPWAMWPCCSARACGTGGPKKTRKTIRNA